MGPPLCPRFTSNDLVNLAKVKPPRNTRAFGGSEIIGNVILEGWVDFLKQTAAHHDPRRPPYVINWSVLQLQGSSAFVMADPFRTYMQDIVRGLSWELRLLNILETTRIEKISKRGTIIYVIPSLRLRIPSIYSTLHPIMSRSAHYSLNVLKKRYDSKPGGSLTSSRFGYTVYT